MCRMVAVALLIKMCLAAGSVAYAQPDPAAPPLTYEVQINGESFLVEANRAATVQSKEKSGVSYAVAVRVAPTQRVRLNTLQFEYSLPAKVEEDGKGENRSARLTHELGFSILFTDLGKPLDSKAQDTGLKLLVESAAGALREDKAAKIEITEPHQHDFAGSAGRGVTIRYRDAKDVGHVCLLYLLTGPTFSASCVVEYRENDSDDVLPLILKTLDSVRAIDKRR